MNSKSRPGAKTITLSHQNQATSAIWQRLDRMPVKWLLATGLPAGALIGAWLANLDSPWLGGGLFILFLGAAALLSFSGEPLALPETATETAKEPPLPEGWVHIPAGSFLMGSPEGEEGRSDDEGPQHEVHVSAFFCMVHPVTRELYQRVMEETDEEKGKGTLPITEVSWFDAVTFCNRWSERDGLKPCYHIEDEHVEWRREADGYRLPTEAEWEYACRAGTKSRWWFGNDESQLSDHGWFGMCQ